MSVNSKERDRAMAAYMKQHPGRYPDSTMRPWGGEGAGHRALAKTMGAVPNEGSKWQIGMLGGVLCARLGLGSSNIDPAYLVVNKHAA
jgi:hypothetical protein